MNNIYKNITELIGNTPIIKLSKKVNKTDSNIFLKLENTNPGGSVKDRLAIGLIYDAEKKGLINKNSTIIEATSGNTGIGLALICAVKNYNCLIVMPENMSEEREKIMKSLSAKVVLTPADKGMTGSINKAYELNKKIENSYLTSQFQNEANQKQHFYTTGPEIWKTSNGIIDYFIAGIGTGGTFTGISRYLKSKNPQISCYAVEPLNSAVLSGEQAGNHQIKGIGAGFIPKIFDKKICDKIIKISDEQAIDTTRSIIKNEGILCGISSGANVFAALKIAEKNKNKNIYTIICDTAERYLSANLF